MSEHGAVLDCEKLGNHDKHHCHHSQSNPSVNQTLDELDFERGIWYSALSGDKADVERKLMQGGTDVNSADKSGYTALHYACRNGHLEVCQTLLAFKADVNATTLSSKATPLHRAAYMGHVQIISLLLDHGADPSMVDCDNMTALHKAAEKDHMQSVELLLKVFPGAVNMEDNKGRKPGDIAISDEVKRKIACHS